MKITIKDPNGKIVKSFKATGKKTLLNEITEHKVEIHSACLMGMCGACMCKIEKGEENIIKNAKGEPAFPLYHDEVMTCIAKVKENNDSEVILKKIY